MSVTDLSVTGKNMVKKLKEIKEKEIIPGFKGSLFMVKK